MSKIRLLFFILIYLFVTEVSLAKNIYSTKDYILEFNSKNIISEKITKINQIKLKSFKLILSNILTEKNFKYIEKIINPLFVDKFILNIKIKDEKIINNNYYYSIIRINYNKNSIIDYLIANKINYTNYLHPKFLLIVNEKNEIENNLLSKKNNYYKFLSETKNQLNYNFLLPNLDYNDRFIFNKNVYEDNLFEGLNKLNNKYKTEYQIFINSQKRANTYNIKSFLFDNNNYYLINETNIKKLDYKNFFLNINYKSIDKWKEINQIDTSYTSEIFCKININNQNELMFVSNILKSESIIKEVNLKSIKYKENIYKIIYFGEINIFIKSLKKYRLKLTIQNNKCNIIII